MSTDLSALFLASNSPVYARCVSPAVGLQEPSVITHAICRHLRELLGDPQRSEHLFHEHNGILCDLSRQRVTDKTLEVRNLCPALLWLKLLVSVSGYVVPPARLACGITVLISASAWQFCGAGRRPSAHVWDVHIR